MEPGARADVSPGGDESRLVRAPDLEQMPFVLLELRRLWPQDNITVYAGVGMEGEQVHVGWIRDASRRAVRFGAPSFRLALERARLWTRLHPDDAGV